jgi:NADH:ubiquinone oxidoreductase subunit 6 (subunit J)
MIIISKNPIHSILYLILVFCNITFVLIILGIEFLAITFLIVYVGAIAVLFLFVVMMLNIKILELDEVFWKYIPVGLLISSIFLLQIFCYVFKFNIADFYNLFYLDDVSFLKKVHFNLLYIFPTDNCYLNGFSNFNSDVLTPVNLNLIYNQDYFFFIPENLPHSDNLSNSYELTNSELLGWIIYTYTFFIFLVIGLILLLAMIGSIVLVLNQNINVRRQLIFRQTLRNLQSSVILKGIK